MFEIQGVEVTSYGLRRSAGGSRGRRQVNGIVSEN